MVEDKIEIKEEVISKSSEAKIHKEDDQIQLDFSAIGKDNLIKELSEVDILYKSAISKIFLSIFFIEPKMSSYKTGNIIINTTI